MLVADFGYVRALNGRAEKARAATPVRHTMALQLAVPVDRIRAGEALHDSLRDLAAKLVTRA